MEILVRSQWTMITSRQCVGLKRRKRDLIRKATAQSIVQAQEIVHVIIIPCKNDYHFSSEFGLGDIVNQLVYRFLRELAVAKSVGFIYEKNFA
ncbi:hypothetical protein GJ744_004280 [Endocarpon pusillum]|uniref:Uncharacterized protein n=1 Tax=Endocarpon pusillum TaxID=364733 RepID=A0A8H7A6Q2_9EURO|nr:hypothetical protein GJ744_004280 [Endocarpon pusillum]